jgi:hypothetical protein
MILETKLVERVLEKIKAEDERYVERMAGGNITNFGAYQRSAGYRQALADCKMILEQTWEDLQKE